jgi:UDP:flavonoid glycosyltransferase YjiC (YdhE family)
VNILLCPMSDPGYLYPALAAGVELRRRGNDVCVLGRSAAAAVAAQAGLPFTAAEDYGGRTGFSVIRWAATGLAQFRATLRAAAQARPDVLVTSVLSNGTLLAGEVLDIPVVVLGLSVHLWDYWSGGDGEPQLGRPRDNRTRECVRHYNELRERAGLAPRHDPWPQNPLLGAALLLRGDPVFEYPGAVLPERVHHVGPLAWEPPAGQDELDEIGAHLDRTGKPVVYVHLGRFFGGTTQWPRLNAAFTAGPFQAVVEQGRSTDPQPAPGTDILLVRKPWMGPLIDLAGLVLSSGTSAPVLAALLRGRPLGVSPNGSEQPVLAAACVRAGAARYVPDDVSGDCRGVLRSVWADRGLRDRARALGGRLAAADGARRAADLIERAVTGRGSGDRYAAHGQGAADGTRRTFSEPA